MRDRWRLQSSSAPSPELHRKIDPCWQRHPPEFVKQIRCAADPLNGPARRARPRDLMESQKRKTGISVVGDRPWGSHLCLFYETKEDLLEMVVPYLKAGSKAASTASGLFPIS